MEKSPSWALWLFLCYEVSYAKVEFYSFQGVGFNCNGNLRLYIVLPGFFFFIIITQETSESTVLEREGLQRNC